MRTDYDYSNRSKIYIIVGTLIIIVVAVILILNNNKDIKIEFDESNACLPNTYDGTEKKLANVETGTEYTVTNNSATNAGEYNVTLTANEGYKFKDRKKEKTITCTINKAPTTLDISKDSIVLTKNGKTSITIDTSLEGKITLNVPDNIVKINGSKEIDIKKDKITVNLEEVSSGKTNLQITFTPNDPNYETVNKNIEINCTDKISVNIPTNSICNRLSYNGKTQKLVSKTDYEGYTLKGQLEGTNPGSYKIEAELKSGYIWSDGKTTDKTITCSISKTEQYSLKTSSDKCIPGEVTYVYIDKTEKAASWRENSVINIKHNDSLTTVTKKESCDPTYYLSDDNKIVSEASRCIYPGRYEISCKKVGSDTITFTMDNNDVLTTTIKIESGETVKLQPVKTVNNVQGINCTQGKTITFDIMSYKDGAKSNIIKSYSIENTSIATVSKVTDEAATLHSCLTKDGCTELSIKCVKNRTTNLIIKTNNGSTIKFPIKHIS